MKYYVVGKSVDINALNFDALYKALDRWKSHGDWLYGFANLEEAQQYAQDRRVYDHNYHHAIYEIDFETDVGIYKKPQIKCVLRNGTLMQNAVQVNNRKTQKYKIVSAYVDSKKIDFTESGIPAFLPVDLPELNFDVNTLENIANNDLVQNPIPTIIKEPNFPDVPTLNDTQISSIKEREIKDLQQKIEALNKEEKDLQAALQSTSVELQSLEEKPRQTDSPKEKNIADDAHARGLKDLLENKVAIEECDDDEVDIVGIDTDIDNTSIRLAQAQKEQEEIALLEQEQQARREQAEKARKKQEKKARKEQERKEQERQERERQKQEDAADRKSLADQAAKAIDDSQMQIQKARYFQFALALTGIVLISIAFAYAGIIPTLLLKIGLTAPITKAAMATWSILVGAVATTALAGLYYLGNILRIAYIRSKLTEQQCYDADVAELTPQLKIFQKLFCGTNTGMAVVEEMQNKYNQLPNPMFDDEGKELGNRSRVKVFFLQFQVKALNKLAALKKQPKEYAAAKEKFCEWKAPGIF